MDGTDMKRLEKARFFFLAIALLVVGAICAIGVNTARAAPTQVYPLGEGYIENHGTSYPPTSGEQWYYGSNPSYEMEVGQWILYGEYFTWRGYLSFDTSSIAGTVTSAALYFSVANDSSIGDFNINLYSGSNQWVSSPSWGSCQNYEATMSTSGISTGVYYSLPVSSSHINTTGLTQFRLTSSREGTPPTTNEWVTIDNGYAGNRPYLLVTTSTGGSSSIYMNINNQYQSGGTNETLNWYIGLWNEGGSPDNFEIQSVSDNAGWSPFITGYTVGNWFSLTGGGSTSFWLHVTIPAGTPLGTIDDIFVVARAQHDNSATVNGYAQVTTSRSVTTSIAPTVQTGNSGAVLSYTVTIHNTGNVSDTYAIHATDNAGWSPSVSPSLIIGPNSSDTAPLSITVPDNAPNNTIDNITITVIGTGDNASGSCLAIKSSHSLPVPQILTPLDGSTANINATIYFTATAVDNENDNLDFFSFSWDFGDNSTSTGSSSTHAYTAIGSYNVILTVSNGYGDATDSITITIKRSGGSSGGPSWVPPTVNNIVKPYTNVLFRTIMMIGPFSLNLFWLLLAVIALAWRFEKGGKGHVKGVMWSAILITGFLFIFGAGLGIL